MVDPIGICEKHQLPLDRSGECELCRLSEMPSKAPPARSAWWAFIIPLILLLAATAWAFSASGPDAGTPPEQGVRTEEPASPEPEAAEPPEAESEPAPEPEERPRQPEPPEPGHIPRPEDFQQPKPGPEGSSGEAPPARPQAPADAETPAWKMELARQRVMVTMYTTSWCQVCRRARDYMTENRIEFMELDTDQSPTASKRLLELNPGRTVPTFQLDALIYVGFREDAFEAKLNQAARRHL